VSITNKAGILLFLSFIITIDGICQYIPVIGKIDSANVYKPARFKMVVISESLAWGGSLVLLNDLWYKNFPRSSFHFFNDNGEWLQMDKAGHASSSYLLSFAGYESFKWTGVNHNKAIWLGGSIGFLYESVIEILDGFSSGWGFSAGDEAANTFGTALFMSQQLAWHEQRIMLKRSYHQTIFPKYNPDLLGSNLSEQINKDYNGLTFWISGNISSFLAKDAKFPKWLNVDFGYGAEGMIGARQNPAINHEGIPIPYYNRYRQFYFSPDIDFSRIKTNSKFLKKVFFVLNIVKFPAPTLEFSEKRLRLIPVYF